MNLVNKQNEPMLRQTLDQVNGYMWECLCLDASDYGLPQHRRQLYIVMLRNDAMRDAPFCFPTRSTESSIVSVKKSEVHGVHGVLAGVSRE